MSVALKRGSYTSADEMPAVTPPFSTIRRSSSSAHALTMYSSLSATSIHDSTKSGAPCICSSGRYSARKPLAPMLSGAVSSTVESSHTPPYFCSSRSRNRSVKRRTSLILVKSMSGRKHRADWGPSILTVKLGAQSCHEAEIGLKSGETPWPSQ